MEINLYITINATLTPQDMVELAGYLGAIKGDIKVVDAEFKTRLLATTEERCLKMVRNNDYTLFKDMFGEYVVCTSTLDYLDHLYENLPRAVDRVSAVLKIPPDGLDSFIEFIYGDPSFTALHKTITNNLK